MANRCFVTAYSIQSTPTPGTFAMIADLTLFRDDATEVYQISADAEFNFGMSVAAIEAALVAKIREIADVSGHTLPATNGIIRLDLVKS